MSALPIGGANQNTQLGARAPQVTPIEILQVNLMSSKRFEEKMSATSNTDLSTMLSSPFLSADRKSEIAAEITRRRAAAEKATTEAQKQAEKHATTADRVANLRHDAATTSNGIEEREIDQLLNKVQSGKASQVEINQLCSLLKNDAFWLDKPLIVTHSGDIK